MQVSLLNNRLLSIKIFTFFYLCQLAKCFLFCFVFLINFYHSVSDFALALTKTSLVDAKTSLCKNLSLPVTVGGNWSTCHFGFCGDYI